MLIIIIIIIMHNHNINIPLLVSQRQVLLQRTSEPQAYFDLSVLYSILDAAVTDY